MGAPLQLSLLFALGSRTPCEKIFVLHRTVASMPFCFRSAESHGRRSILDDTDGGLVGLDDPYPG